MHKHVVCHVYLKKNNNYCNCLKKRDSNCKKQKQKQKQSTIRKRAPNKTNQLEKT